MAQNTLLPFHLINAVSMAATITSSAVEHKYQDNVGIQLTWTGTPTGTFDVQISVDHAQDAQGNVTNAGNWVSLPLSPAISASGSADTAYIEINQLSAAYYRVVYTRVSSTGTLNCYVISKGV